MTPSSKTGTRPRKADCASQRHQQRSSPAHIAAQRGLETGRQRGDIREHYEGIFLRVQIGGLLGRHGIQRESRFGGSFESRLEIQHVALAAGFVYEQHVAALRRAPPKSRSDRPAGRCRPNRCGFRRDSGRTARRPTGTPPRRARRRAPRRPSIRSPARSTRATRGAWPARFRTRRWSPARAPCRSRKLCAAPSRFQPRS